jgi:hypothetical protein
VFSGKHVTVNSAPSEATEGNEKKNLADYDPGRMPPQPVMKNLTI